MRGKVIGAAGGCFFVRITHAYAGKSLLWNKQIGADKDHPRLCGEKVPPVTLHHIFKGSPPPMRGKGSKSSVDAGKYRITPAYAGKSANGWKLSPTRRDHPRLCGEKKHTLFKNVQRAGSPPPMRGKAKRIKQQFSLERITPAYAGKSLDQFVG